MRAIRAALIPKVRKQMDIINFIRSNIVCRVSRPIYHLSLQYCTTYY